ncbi:Crp/Fnr family transcriptional regulator [Novosphingobium sp.]|uniref:Crp/Fnr family transcriptional regulator n=1 Tax=Novosphingobium sp. TaxID=1874826 RepID=UPI0025EBF53A|nr:Crp/Fnr family transcriptional regulator [Novosphingobium sp.]MCC6924298.1 Crp/Fnr family transcriptional regulator [Novosphingobium sp.]
MVALAGEVLLDLISPPARSWLAQIAQRRSYGHGELIHNRGDLAAAMGIVVKGQIRLVRLQADGSHTFVSMIRAGQHFGDVVMLGQRRRSHDAIAEGEVEIDLYDADAFELVQNNLEIVRALYRITALRLSGSMAMSDDLRSLPRDVHLAKILLALWQREGGQTTFDCTQEDLASMLGTSVMSLSKHLKVLKQAGLVETGYRQLRIVDPEVLRAWLRGQSKRSKL